MDTAVYRLLALCAHAEGGPAFYAQLAQSAAGLTDWTVVAAQAKAHGMAPLVYRHLRSAGVEIPPSTKRELQGLALRHRQADAVRTRVLRDVLKTFSAVNLPALAIKGAALSHLVYVEPGLRPMSDTNHDIFSGNSLALE